MNTTNLYIFFPTPWACSSFFKQSSIQIYQALAVELFGLFMAEHKELYNYIRHSFSERLHKLFTCIQLTRSFGLIFWVKCQERVVQLFSIFPLFSEADTLLISPTARGTVKSIFLLVLWFFVCFGFGFGLVWFGICFVLFCFPWITSLF